MQRRLPVLDELGEVTDESGAVKSTYASWEDTVETIRPILFRHGFALSFRPGLSARGEPVVVGVLRHEAGHKEEAELVLPADVSGGKNPVQAVGSSLSYGQRYVTKLLLNLASRRVEDDDDGQMAGSVQAERDAIVEINALESEEHFPAWKRDQPQTAGRACASVLPAGDRLLQHPARPHPRARSGGGMRIVRQRTAEWESARLGKATASRIAEVIAKTKSGYAASRANYAAQLICERLTGVKAEAFESAAMRWGVEKETEALELYAFEQDADVVQVGFLDHPKIAMAGASPDGLVGR